MASTRFIVLLSLIVLVSTTSAVLHKRFQAPLLAGDSPTRIDGEYVVILNEDASDQDVDDHKMLVRQLMSNHDDNSYIMKGREWKIGNFKGYGAVMSDRIRDTVRRMSIVSYMEYNQVYKANAQCVNQIGATWGIVRTTYEEEPVVEDYSYSSSSAGEGVNVYIVDTGIYTQHPDFGGRAIWGKDFIDDPSPMTDLNGHGTHVAGTVMADLYGLARKATAVAVRVLDQNGSGTTIGVVGGIDWTAKQHTSKKKSIANMSLGGGKSTALNNAVAAAVDAGVTFVVAAGNEGQDACNTSPASETKAYTVAASDDGDDFAYFSNYGDCVDIIAPGVDITSTWLDGGTNTISGTSMAAPHVAGVMAKYLSHETYDPTQLANKITNEATGNKISMSSKIGRKTPNKLVFKSCDTF